MSHLRTIFTFLSHARSRVWRSSIPDVALSLKFLARVQEWHTFRLGHWPCIKAWPCMVCSYVAPHIFLVENYTYILTRLAYSRCSTTVAGSSQQLCRVKLLCSSIQHCYELKKHFLQLETLRRILHTIWIHVLQEIRNLVMNYEETNSYFLGTSHDCKSERQCGVSLCQKVCCWKNFL